ncbi:hypothetical protein ITJ88_06160 [Exiguobacterium sp. TBG-PICH-001]|uniref:hypothetical protein n=1 Tax=Exiguobacterium abrahamii TaxID=2785532 RepID=UPI0018A74DEA|nr:hypothetical protein [Exiguobacterium sp. TBG-PICH-001]MBF8152865.1 hypothetical protein [Exiguobacterium sp. TBG-PICH-001]
MHPLTKDLISHIQDKYQLNDYVLHETFYRREKIHGETQYSLETCWFPINHGPWSEDESYPDGTIEIQVDTATKRTTAIHKNGAVTIHSLPEDLRDPDIRIAWLEQELGMTFEKQFMFLTHQDSLYQYVSCHHGIRLSPGLFISLELTNEGALDSFSVYGTPALSNKYSTESFTLSLEQMAPIISQQFRSFSVPNEHQRKLAYAIEEIFVSENGLQTYPLDDPDTSAVTVNEVVTWDKPSTFSYTRKLIKRRDTVTALDAEAQTPHPDYRPLTEEMLETCQSIAVDLIAAEYPEESGAWTIQEIHRDFPFINVVVRRTRDDINLAYKRRLTILLMEDTFEVSLIVDNKAFIDLYHDSTQGLPDSVSEEVIRHALMPYLTLKPYYVFDRVLDHYVLCGLLDSNHAYLSATNEVVLLRDL